MRTPRIATLVLLAAGCLFETLVGTQASAGIFNTVHFVDPGKIAIGVEPEFTLSDGAGLGFNGKFTEGVSDLLNIAEIVGTGGGPRQFRIGFDADFDFFPDVDRQPGIGLLMRTIYYRIPDSLIGIDDNENTGRLELTAVPYLHKAFAKGSGDAKETVDPFIAVPVGLAFTSGHYHGTSQLVIGSLFQSNEKIAYSMELGINMNNTETYISGGITVYP
jgi:hypothetical protein